MISFALLAPAMFEFGLKYLRESHAFTSFFFGDLYTSYYSCIATLHYGVCMLNVINQFGVKLEERISFRL